MSTVMRAHGNGGSCCSVIAAAAMPAAATANASVARASLAASHTRCSSDKTPLQLAVEKNKTSVEDLLRRHGAR